MDKRKRLVMIVVFLLIVAVIALIAVLIINGKNNKSVDDDDDTSTSLVKAKKKLELLCSNVNSKGKYEDEGVIVCDEFVCMYEDKNYVYTVDCLDDDFEIEKTKKVSNTIRANIILSSACSNPNVRGYYEDESTTCSDFICETEIDGKSYTKDCRV